MSIDHVAWVPDDDSEREWGTAAGFAATWVEDRCSREGLSGLLVTNTMHNLGIEELDAFSRRHARTSPRSSQVGSGQLPVLSYVPGPEELEFATRLADRSSLAVVESVAFPLDGWAAWLGARNLISGEATPHPPEAILTEIDRLKFYGNNGFGDTFAKNRARQVLGDLRAAGAVDSFVVGAALAAGVSARGVGNLRRIMAKT